MAGVDGAREGWVVARVEADRIGWAVLPTAAQVLAATRGCAAVGVDIPLGFPAGPAGRACEREAERRLGRARASVFRTPPREVLQAPTHAEACRVAKRLTGKAISIQSYGIRARILDWDAVPDRPDGLVEVHPELSFRRLAPDVAFAGKKSARGAGQRLAALGRWLGDALVLPDLPAAAALDDALDALAAAWSARRWLCAEAERLGPERDDRGRPACIVV